MRKATSQSSANLRALVPDNGDDDWRRETLTGNPGHQIAPLLRREYTHQSKAQGWWTSLTSGGSLKEPTWRRNPQFSLGVRRTCRVKVTLTLCDRQPGDDHNGLEDQRIGVYILRRGGLAGCDHMRLVLFASHNFVAVSEFGVDQVTCEVELAAMDLNYVLIPATHSPSHRGKFLLSVHSTGPTTLASMDSGNCVWQENVGKGWWHAHDPPHAVTNHGSLEVRNFTAGGCRHHYTWRLNPQFKLICTEPTTVIFSLRQLLTAGQDPENIGLYVATKNTAFEERKMTLKNRDLVSKTLFKATEEVHAELVNLPVSKNGYRVIPATFEAGRCAPFELSVWSNHPVELAEVHESWAMLSVDTQLHSQRPLPRDVDSDEDTDDESLRSRVPSVSSDVDATHGAPAIPPTVQPPEHLPVHHVRDMSPLEAQATAPSRGASDSPSDRTGPAHEFKFPHALFRLTLDQSAVVVVSLLQTDSKVEDHMREAVVAMAAAAAADGATPLTQWADPLAETERALMPLGFHLLRVHEPTKKATTMVVEEISATPCDQVWEISSRLHLPAGQYLIIACSRLLGEPTVKGEGTLARVASGSLRMSDHVTLGLFSPAKTVRAQLELLDSTQVTLRPYEHTSKTSKSSNEATDSCTWLTTGLCWKAPTLAAALVSTGWVGYRAWKYWKTFRQRTR